MTTRARACAVAGLLAACPGADVFAHGVSASDKAFMQQGGLLAFLYLGAKHMVTGYDHLLFLLGVIFFLYRLRDVAAYVTLFVSLTFFVLALRHLGTARTGAYFSLAPFFGAAASLVVLRESIGVGFVAAGILMAIGAWLHLTERHQHEHHHERLEHSHRHVHDEHHQHAHDGDVAAGEPHTHVHVHEPMIHRHPHYPDIHHRHRHN